MQSIDLNADLGEHPNTTLDEQIMPFISSCNVACGGHIGDEFSVRQTLLLATKFDVAIGAHPSFPDRENFGRKMIEISEVELKKSLKEQVELVYQMCREEKVKMHHVKPHGALYNLAAQDKRISMLILEILQEMSEPIYWMGLANSASQQVAAEHHFPFIAEGFADRHYEQDGSLRSRSKEGAVLLGQQVLDQVSELALNKRVRAESWLPLDVQSICLHGDTEGAVTLAKEIRTHLENKGVHIAAVQQS